MSSLVTFIERAADLLSGVDGLHWRQLLASRWMATDGTGLKVIVPGCKLAVPLVTLRAQLNGNTLIWNDPASSNLSSQVASSFV
jgi:hypothetical protein